MKVGIRALRGPHRMVPYKLHLSFTALFSLSKSAVVVGEASGDNIIITTLFSKKA